MDPGLTVIHLGIRLGIGENRHFLAFEIFKKTEIIPKYFTVKKTVIFTTLVVSHMNENDRPTFSFHQVGSLKILLFMPLRLLHCLSGIIPACRNEVDK